MLEMSIKKLKFKRVQNLKIKKNEFKQYYNYIYLYIIIYIINKKIYNYININIS